MSKPGTRAVRWLGFAIPWLALALFFAVDFWKADSRPLASERLYLLGALFVMRVPVLIYSSEAFHGLRREDDPAWYRRPGLWRVLRNMLFYVPFVVLLSATFGRVWTWDSIGVAKGPDGFMAVIVGLSSVVAFAGVLGAAYAVAPREMTTSPAPYRSLLLRRHLSRGQAAGFLHASDLVLISPAIEEVVCRGFLVYLAGELFGSVLLAVAIGLLLSIAEHLYMGPGVVLSVALFYLSTIALLYSPFGLVSALVFHAGCNARFFACHRAQVAEYLDGLRGRRLCRQRAP
jgi:hypothetical protein